MRLFAGRVERQQALHVAQTGIEIATGGVQFVEARQYAHRALAILLAGKGQPVFETFLAQAEALQKIALVYLGGTLQVG